MTFPMTAFLASSIFSSLARYSVMAGLDSIFCIILRLSLGSVGMPLDIREESWEAKSGSEPPKPLRRSSMPANPPGEGAEAVGGADPEASTSTAFG